MLNFRLAENLFAIAVGGAAAAALLLLHYYYFFSSFMSFNSLFLSSFDFAEYIIGRTMKI